MPGFIAQTEVEPLEFDFRPYADLSGVIPEPSQDQVNQFFEKARKAANTARSKDGGPVIEEGDNQALARDLERMGKANKAILDSVSVLTSGAITRKQLGDLPYRPVNGFIVWLIGELSPKDKTNATNSTPETDPNVS